MSSGTVLRLSVLALILALCAQVLVSIRTTSPTFDEPYHVLRSYVYLRTGDIALVAQGGHPPLANMLSVIPLLLRRDIQLPPHQRGWPNVRQFQDLFTAADAFFWRIGNNAESITFWSRLPTVLLSALLAFLVFSWARHLHGSAAGLLALLLCAFDPNIVAHSSVVTTDLGATLFIFATVYGLWQFCRRPSWGGLLLTAIAFGLAQATKFSSLFLIPICLAILMIWVFERGGASLPMRVPGQGCFSRHPTLRRLCVAFGLGLIILCVGFVVLWAVYGLQARPLLPHEDSHPLLDRFIPGGNGVLRQVAYAVAENLPVPAPAYFADLAWLQRYARAGHASFVMGSYSRTGWWFYFPLAFLIKTPIPLLLLLLIAAWLSIQHRKAWRDEYFLLIPIALFFVLSMFSSIDIGYRNVLPVLPFAFVYVSEAAALLRGRLPQLVLLALIAWYVAGTVALGPHYFAHFNEFVGGPANGYKYLVDSNLDWGQDLKHLKSFIQARGIDQLYLSYFGTADPHYYGINSLPMPDQPPAADTPSAYYAISATSLQGVYSPGEGAHWLAEYRPVDRVGYSIFIYRLP